MTFEIHFLIKCATSLSSFEKISLYIHFILICVLKWPRVELSVFAVSIYKCDGPLFSNSNL